MEFNYEKRYAYAEVEAILNWLGENYINKIPAKLIRIIKNEKKFAYRPKIDFSKPLETQVRQETKNIIAYLNLNYWLEDEKEKKAIKEAIKENAKKEKEKRKLERMQEIEEKARTASTSTVTASIDKALRKNNEGY